MPQAPRLSAAAHRLLSGFEADVLPAGSARPRQYSLSGPVPTTALLGWNGFAQALAAAEAGDASAFSAQRVTSPQDSTFAGLAVFCVDYAPVIFGPLSLTWRWSLRSLRSAIVGAP
jgi:hypothetical protein